MAPPTPPPQAPLRRIRLLKDDLPVTDNEFDLDAAPMHGSQESLFDLDAEPPVSAATTGLDRNGSPKASPAASPEASQPAPSSPSASAHAAPAGSPAVSPPVSTPVSTPGPASAPAPAAAAPPGPASSPGAVGEGASIAPLAATLHQILQKEITPEQYQTWFQRSALVRIDDQTATIAVPNSFALEWVKRYYLNILESTLTKLLGQRRRIELVAQPEVFIDEAAAAQPSNKGPAVTPVAQTTGSPTTGSPTTGSPTTGSHPPAAPQTNGHPSADAAGRPPSRGPGSMDAAAEANGADMIPAAPPARRQQTPAPPRREAPANGTGSERRIMGKLESSSDFVLNTKCTFDNFVVGPCNRFGHAASMGAAEQPGKSYNPLFLHGPVGVGKTHLLQAFCFSVLERFPDYRILYLSCETFVNHFISALDTGDMQRFRDKYRDIDVLVIDDIQTLANKEKSQEEFFHTFNSLYNAGKQIVLSADCPPTDIPTLHDRLVSRFKWGMVTEIEPPCYETRMAIVKRKSRERGGEVPDEIAQFIAENIEENVRELEGAVTRLLAYSRMTGSEISLDLAREALAGLIEVRKGAPTVDDIINIVTDHYQVKLSDLQSKRRPKAIAFPRQVAMYLARKVTRHSLEEIGGFFGGRDHTTVLYAVDKMEKLVAKDVDFSKEMQVFMDRLGSTGRQSG